MIQGIIFDWGGVLCEDPSPGFIQYCSAKLQLEPAVLAPGVARHLPDFMRGLPENEFWQRVGMHLSLEIPTTPLWGEALAAVYKPLDETLSIAKGLSEQGIRIGLLTNTEPPSQGFHLSLGYDFFHGRVFSCSEGLSKPDPQIYKLIASRLDLAPEHCLMVDDRVENIAGATHAGMPGHLFTTPAKFRQALVQLGLL